MITVYGIKNCDTCRKALKWLAAEDIEHRFHDFRVDGLDPSSLSTWVKAAGWEKLLNRRGTTWRNLSDGEKDGVDEVKAEALMAGNPTLIKRPVFETGDMVLVGFGDAERDALKR
jgi:arsenate reductase